MHTYLTTQVNNYKENPVQIYYVSWISLLQLQYDKQKADQI